MLDDCRGRKKGDRTYDSPAHRYRCSVRLENVTRGASGSNTLGGVFDKGLVLAKAGVVGEGAGAAMELTTLREAGHGAVYLKGK